MAFCDKFISPDLDIELEILQTTIFFYQFLTTLLAIDDVRTPRSYIRVEYFSEVDLAEHPELSRLLL